MRGDIARNLYPLRYAIVFNMDGYTIHIMFNDGIMRSRSKRIAYTALMIALAVTLRVMKASIVGPIQFVNFPGVFTIVSGIILGPVIGLVVGVGSYLISDIFIGLAGLWTITNMLLMGGIGIISGLIWKRSNRTAISKIGVGVGTYLIMLAFDVLSSIALFVFSGTALSVALLWGILGLFMPVGGGYVYGMGPVTEGVTAILVVAIANVLLKNKITKL